MRVPLVLRAALLTLPPRFRRRFAGEISDLYRLREIDARRHGATAVARLRLRAAFDVLRTGLAERRRSSFLPRNLHPGQNPPNGDGSMRTLLYDLRHAARAILKRPTYALIVLATLAVGIGANTAIFTVVNGVLLTPVATPEPEELVRVLSRFEPESGFDIDRFSVLSIPEYVDYAAQTEALEAVAIFMNQGISVTGEGHDAARERGASVTPSLFRVFPTTPLHGRVLVPEDGVAGSDPVALLSQPYWETRYGADPGIVGSSITLDGTDHEIVGILSADYLQPAPETEIWRPLPIDPANPGGRSTHYVVGVGRLADGVEFEAAESELDRLMSGWAEEFPDVHTGHYLYLQPLHADAVRNVRPALLMLLAASGFVLLIVCANVAAVLLARGEERGRELAIRSAVGAGRLRLAQIVVGESLLLSGFGGVLGVGVAWLGVRVLLDLQAAGIPRGEQVGVDATVLGFALGVTALTALLFSLAPALNAASLAPRDHLLEGDARSGGSRRQTFYRRALVVAEVALSFVLVVGAGLMIRTAQELTTLDPGYASEGVLVAGLSLPASAYPDDESLIAFKAQLVERAAALPGVEAAAVSGAVPMYNGTGSWDFSREGRGPRTGSDEIPNGQYWPVGGNFLSTIQARLVRGRMFDDTDSATSEPVALINQELQRRFFPDEDPIGQRIRVGSNDEGNTLSWMRIVGIVEDMRTNSLDQEPAPAYFSLYEQGPLTAGNAWRFQALVLRTSGDPQQLVSTVRALVADLDPNLPLISPQPLREAVVGSVARTTFTTRLLSSFAVVALLLGATGIYGVLAYSVAQRTREIGIRKALGARPAEVLRMVVGQGMVPVVVGLVVGGVGSVAVGRAMAGLLYGVEPLDPVTYAVVTAVLGTVAVVACLAPAVRAVRLDTQIALRAD